MLLVDMGTKHGDAIDAFRHQEDGSAVSALTRIVPSGCCGYERPEAEKYRSIVERKGYGFRIANLADPSELAKLPQAQIYLAWHFLEHLPDKTCADLAVKAALTKAQHLAWFRLPSFEQDSQLGEGALRQHGLRFSWTFWTGHPTAWLVADCLKSIADWQHENPGRAADVTVKPADYVHDTDNDRVVPVSAPLDSNYYSAELGPKPPTVKFNPPLVSAWEVIVSFQR